MMGPHYWSSAPGAQEQAAGFAQIRFPLLVARG